MRTSQLTLLPLLVLGLAAGVAAQEPLPTAPPTFVEVPGEMEFTGVMVARPIQVEDAARFGISVAEAQAHAMAANQALRALDLLDYVPETDETLFRVQPGSEYSVARRLMAGGDFEYVTPDWRVYPIECPNDPLFNQQWHHAGNRMNSCAGWGLEKGSLSVVVAVCDTGVRKNHEDLKNYRLEGYNAVDKQWENAGGAVADINGHGTHTTGCAAAQGDNNLGVIGTGWSLSHRMMRVSNDPGGGSSMSTLTHAARTAADTGDKVASVSYSGVTDPSVKTTGNYVRGKGALLVWAAGNSNSKLKGKRDDGVIVVGATDSSDGKASFSSYGKFVDLFAPGTNILSTYYNSNQSYANASGTSMATPLVAGLVGLIFSADPTLTPEEAEEILRCGCDDIGPKAEDNTYGFGRIDVERSMKLALLWEVLYADGFESGDFAAGGWTTSGGAPAPIVTDKADHTGTYGARVRDTAWIERAVDTTGYDEIALKVNHRTKNFDSGEFVNIEWWDGSSWNSVDTTKLKAWRGRFLELPAGADDNASFKIRFSTNGNETKERCDIDDVKVLGIKL